MTTTHPITSMIDLLTVHNGLRLLTAHPELTWPATNEMLYHAAENLSVAGLEALQIWCEDQDVILPDYFLVAF